MDMGSELVIETVRLIESGDTQANPQQESDDLKPAPKITAENSRIDWTRSVEEAHNFVRGLSPYPASWTILRNDVENLRVKIYLSEPINMIHEFEFGTVLIENSVMKVACKNGFLNILEIQLPGKRKMAVKDLLNGYSVKNNAMML